MSTGTLHGEHAGQDGDKKERRKNMTLPPASPDQACVSLTLLSGGYLHLPSKLFVQGASDDETLVCPSMSWLLTHEPSQTKLIFDLGIRRDIENYTPAVYHRLQTLIPVDVAEDVFASLDAAGLDPSTDIDTVIFSHLHYDHVGDPSRFGGHTTFTVGPGASTAFLDSASSAYPHDRHSHFDSRLLPRHQINQLPPPPEGSANDGFWNPLGPFPAAHDLFGDSSVYIVDAPGHLTGHINLLVRTDREKWMYLAGDTAHDPRILDGSREIAVYPDPHCGGGRFKCAHADRDAAEVHLARVRALREDGDHDVEVVLAHDAGWLERNGKNFSISRN